MPSFEQGANRKWSVRFRFVEFGKVKQKRLSGYDTKKDADKAYADFIFTHKQYIKSDYSNITFKELYQKYFEYVSKSLKPSSIYDIEHNFKNHILPIFSDMKVYEISKHDILNWQNNLNNQVYKCGAIYKPYKYEFKSKLRGQLSNVFKFAIYYYDLPTNPVSQVAPFKSTEQKQEMQVWSLEQFQKFISSFKSNELEYKSLFAFLYLTGCRKGEALALTWQDIDFSSNKVTINKNITRKSKNNRYEVVSTKTREYRTIAIPDNLIQLLTTLRDSKNSIYVFGDKDPLADTTISRVFYKHIKETGLPQIHIHCLRHSHASLLISNGESIVMVAKRLGHSSIEQTLNTYSHLMPDDEKKMLKNLEVTI